MEAMTFFKPRKIIDTKTGKIRIISPEEQEEMLERGILFDIKSEPTDTEKASSSDKDKIKKI